VRRMTQKMTRSKNEVLKNESPSTIGAKSSSSLAAVVEEGEQQQTDDKNDHIESRLCYACRPFRVRTTKMTTPTTCSRLTVASFNVALKFKLYNDDANKKNAAKEKVGKQPAATDGVKNSIWLALHEHFPSGWRMCFIVDVVTVGVLEEDIHFGNYWGVIKGRYCCWTDNGIQEMIFNLTDCIFRSQTHEDAPAY
jgi:hypothetical protein